MPEIVLHRFFAREVLHRLPKPVQDHIDPEVYALGSRGPDPLGIVYFYRLPRWKREHGKSNLLHTKGCGLLFRSLTEEAKSAPEEIRQPLFSFLAGFLTHYALDSTCHPYIIFQAGAGKENAGNHRSLEHALDRKRLKEQGMDLHARPITRELLPKAGLPPGIRPAVDAAFRKAFGWEDAWKLLNRAYRDERRFLRLTEDPVGSFYGLLRRVTANRNLRSLSYAEPSYPEADIANGQHRAWRNPYAPEITSRRSMADLETEAANLAEAWITGVHASLYEAGDFPEAIGNRSFESGLDADDSRNNGPITCSVLPGRESTKEAKTAWNN